MRQKAALNQPEISFPCELLPSSCWQGASEEEGIDLMELATLLLQGKKPLYTV
jgi:hypothetical protein